MTRINTVPPQELSDAHLTAEIREIGRVPTAVLKRLRQGKSLPHNIPHEFKLGSGHVIFFYDKIKFLFERKLSLESEAINRGFENSYSEDDGRWISCKTEFPECWNNWTPTKNSLQILRDRLKDRILSSNRNPRYYRKTYEKLEFLNLVNY